METIQIAAAKKKQDIQVQRVILYLVSRTELGMYPFKTDRDTRKLEWHYKVRNRPKRRLPAIVDRVYGRK